MIIYETNIPDVLSQKDSNLYENIGREMEKYISPIFSEEYLRNQEEIFLFEKSLQDNKIKLKDERIKCQELLDRHERQKIIKDLLNKIYKVINFGLINKDKKEDIILLLKGLDNLDTKLIQKHSKDLEEIIQSSKKTIL